MPGQTPYEAEELDELHRQVADAAAGDPGELGEIEHPAGRPIKSEAHYNGLPDYRPESLKAFWETGLLHAVNEQVLWPLGLCLTLVVMDGTREAHDWSTAELRFDIDEEALATGMSAADHADVHVRLAEYKAERLRTIKA